MKPAFLESLPGHIRGSFLAVLLVAAVAGQTVRAENPTPDSKKEGKWGPHLSAEEKAGIARLSVPELTEMVRKGDAVHGMEALSVLERGSGWRDNLNLLLGIAAENRSDMIVEGLVQSQNVGDSPADQQAVDRYLDFLEKQLSLDKPAVSAGQCVRSIGQAVRPKRPHFVPPTAERPKIPAPYGIERAVRILTVQLDSPKPRARWAAIGWLGSLANCPEVRKDIKVLLEAQEAKEQAFAETPEQTRPGSGVSREQLVFVVRRALISISHAEAVETPSRPVDSSEQICDYPGDAETSSQPEGPVEPTRDHSVFEKAPDDGEAEQ
ncbi:MAG: hypothetical protein JW955_08345 [Sedimentisphaerales bacterium]|nr:hypothetical protein [Sedimentisphaerales bacterium]